MEPGEQCRVETREVTKPVCVTMMDKVVEEVMQYTWPLFL